MVYLFISRGMHIWCCEVDLWFIYVLVEECVSDIEGWAVSVVSLVVDLDVCWSSVKCLKVWDNLRSNIM